MILVFGLLLGWDVANEVAQRLGINKDQLYNRLKESRLGLAKIVFFELEQWQ